MFRILVRGRNCANFVSKCLSSLQKQKTGNWKAYVMLDQPTDNTVVIATQWAKQDDRIVLYENQKCLGLCRNLWHGIETIRADNPNNEDIICIVDGDDWLYRGALVAVSVVYKRHPECVFTYGSYVKYSKGKRTRISREYGSGANVRKCKWRASHLKTVKWRLLKHLPIDVFLDDKGNWFKAASDVAMTIPLIEMAGLKRCRHIHKILYYWRDKTDHRTHRAQQKRVVKKVRAKKSMKRIKL